ncbi:MAG: TolC family protein [Planctomycetota bacterium]
MSRLLRFTPCLLALLVGCGSEEAQEAFHRELARDLGGAERDDDEALEAGRRVTDVAPTDSSAGLTLSDCFQRALQNADTLRAQSETLLQSDAQSMEAIAAVLPKVVFYGTHNRDSDKISFGGGSAFQPRERTSYGVRIEQTILDGKLVPRLDLIEETQQIQALQLRDARDQLLFAVATQFYEVLGYEADLRAIEATRASATETLRVLQARNELGVAREDEVLLAQASAAEAEAREIQTEADLAQARARLESLIQVRPLPALRDTFRVASGPQEIPRLVDLALAQRYDLEAARHAIAAAEASTDEAWSAYLPQVDLTFDTILESEEGFRSQLDWTLGITLDWTLFDGFGREARLARARSVVRQREWELRALEKQARLEVTEAALAFRSLDRALFAFRARSEAAASAYDATEVRLRAGSATHLEVLVSRNTREEAARNLTRTTLGRKLAALRIRRAAGDLKRAAPVADLAPPQ